MDDMAKNYDHGYFYNILAQYIICCRSPGNDISLEKPEGSLLKLYNIV